jgi:hypothetical protein
MTAINRAVELLNSWGAVFTGFAGPMLVQSTVVTTVLLALIWVLKRARAVVRYALLMLILLKLILPPSLSFPTGAAYWLAPSKPRTLRTCAKISSEFPWEEECSSIPAKRGV